MSIDPAVLFFACGVAAGLLRSNLEIPAAVSRFLSLYLLMALGLKGGFALADSGITPQVLAGLACALVLAVAVPLMGWQVLRRRVGPFDAAAIAAAYGSVSAVTFVAAVDALDTRGIAFGGHMAAAMALMEAPAIVLAVLMAHALRRGVASTATAGLRIGQPGVALLPLPGTAPAASDSAAPWRRIVHEALTDGSQVLLLGSMLIGLLTGDAGQAALQPFAGDLFKGLLAFFLLDMGLLAARNLPGLRRRSPCLLAYALVAPVVHATLALGLTRLSGLPLGDTVLLMVLAGSASYIAVPAALRHAIPEADASLYLGLALAVTFPFNLLLGIPLYAAMAGWVMGI